MKTQKTVAYKFGILAYPTKGSLSPLLFNSAFKKLKIDARYDLYNVAPKKFRSFMKELRLSGINGLSVSSPYKRSVINFLDFVSDDAKKIGAVNTISNKGGKLFGFNTDYEGAFEALSKSRKKIGKVLILGAGGAARAIIYGLIKNSVPKKNITVANRTLSNANRISHDFGVNYIKLSDIPKTDFDTLINASAKLPIDFKSLKFKRGALVMDIVYKPAPITPLLAEAKKKRCKIITGENMLLFQAVHQFRLWFEILL